MEKQVKCEEAQAAEASKNASVPDAGNESRNIFRVSNIWVLAYIALNILLIWSVLSWFSYTWKPLAYSLLVYAVSLLVALSPIGEYILRLQTHCKPIKREDHLKLIMPIFEEVYARARNATPSLPKGIKIYMNADNAPNAFATGRRTICVTRGLLKLPPEQIKAILAHEFGHIAHCDTYLLQAVVVGNCIVTVIAWALWLFSLLATTIAKITAVCSPKNDLGVGRGMEIVCTTLAQLAVMIGFKVFMWLWTKLGVLLCMKTSRGNEYEADRFSSNCGYNKELIAAFETLAADSEPSKGIFAMLASSHPDFDDRIARLQDHAKADATTAKIAGGSNGV